jgi:tail-anchored protein insertion receptor
MALAPKTSFPSGQSCGDNSTRPKHPTINLVCCHEYTSALSFPANRSTATTVDASKAKFNTTVNTTRWVATNGVRIFLQYWYSRTPMFWLPYGWVPGYVEWLLSFPRAPKGSISIQLWQIACASILAMLTEAVMALYELYARGALQSKPQGYRSGGEGKPVRMDGGPKKEL